MELSPCLLTLPKNLTEIILMSDLTLVHDADDDLRAMIAIEYACEEFNKGISPAQTEMDFFIQKFISNGYSPDYASELYARFNRVRITKPDGSLDFSIEDFE
jgi:23S rRNA U2552 (ribose-2'-O)-methylase RlmE/FtsJ